MRYRLGIPGKSYISAKEKLDYNVKTIQGEHLCERERRKQMGIKRKAQLEVSQKSSSTNKIFETLDQDLKHNILCGNEFIKRRIQTLKLMFNIFIISSLSVCF